jgi:hypothetical protein
MDAATRNGDAAGRAAAIEDRDGRYDRAIGAELVLAARESAYDWAAGTPPFIDPKGSSIATYVEVYCGAYDAWMDEHAARKQTR